MSRHQKPFDATTSSTTRAVCVCSAQSSSSFGVRGDLASEAVKNFFVFVAKFDGEMDRQCDDSHRALMMEVRCTQ